MKTSKMIMAKTLKTREKKDKYRNPIRGIERSSQYFSSASFTISSEPNKGN